MKTKLALMSLTLCAFAALLLTAAPVPQATAGPSGTDGDSHHGDPCAHTREHYGDDEDFQMWEQICEDTVRELRSRSATAKAMCNSAARDTLEDVRRFCFVYCDRYPNARRIPQYAKSLVSQGQNRASKCAWEAQQDYDAIYENARTQLEDAGYTCLVQKLYTEYRHVQRETLRWERAAYAVIRASLRHCNCRNSGGTD